MKKVEKIFIIVGISALVLSIILGITSITMFSSQMAKDINKIDFDEVARRLGSRFDELDFVNEDGHILIEGEDGFRVEVDESGIDVVGVGDEVDDSDDESSHDSIPTLSLTPTQTRIPLTIPNLRKIQKAN